jgi:hypothetical protein
VGVCVGVGGGGGSAAEPLIASTTGGGCSATAAAGHHSPVNTLLTSVPPHCPAPLAAALAATGSRLAGWIGKVQSSMGRHASRRAVASPQLPADPEEGHPGGEGGEAAAAEAAQQLDQAQLPGGGGGMQVGFVCLLMNRKPGDGVGGAERDGQGEAGGTKSADGGRMAVHTPG